MPLGSKLKAKMFAQWPKRLPPRCAEGRAVMLSGEASQKGAPLSNQFPRQIQAGSFECRHLGKSGIRIVHLCERGIEGVFIAARMILVAETAGGNLHQVACFD